MRYLKKVTGGRSEWFLWVLWGSAFLLTVAPIFRVVVRLGVVLEYKKTLLAVSLPQSAIALQCGEHSITDIYWTPGPK